MPLLYLLCTWSPTLRRPEDQQRGRGASLIPSLHSGPTGSTASPPQLQKAGEGHLLVAASLTWNMSLCLKPASCQPFSIGTDNLSQLQANATGYPPRAALHF